ncbi:MAG: phospholipase D family protein [Actinobacteria bacterium]|nr:phospholipase D family protein [Actinomycetota bacterium]
MTVRLVDGGWWQELEAALGDDVAEVRIASPFIKDGAVEKLFSGSGSSVRVLTRFNLDNFRDGVSDTSALRRLIKRGAEVRGVKRLHAKLYLFDSKQAVITSANMTEAGLRKNHELGVVAEGGAIPKRCASYFDQLWEGAGPNLTIPKLDEWDGRIEAQSIPGASQAGAGLGDEGAVVGALDFPQLPPLFDEPPQAFVKFFGKSDNRALRDYLVLDELSSGGCHWACTYPRNKRPRSVEDGAVMFMSRLVHSPNDTMIFGRAVGQRYEKGRDDASPADLARRPWKKDWPHYIRVHDGEFLDGSMGDGVSLVELMDELGPHAFASTAENLKSGSGNTDPRRSIRQSAAVRLAPAGIEWLNERLELAFQDNGQLQPTQLASLDWPFEIDGPAG